MLKNIIPHFRKLYFRRIILGEIIIIAITICSACGGAAPDGPQPAAKQTPQNMQKGTSIALTPGISPSQAAPEPKSNQDLPVIANVPESELKGITLNLWHSWPDEQIVPLIDEFNRTNKWGITVKSWYQMNSARLSENVSRALIENDAPHIVLGYIDQATRWNNKGQIVDLLPYLKDTQWGLTEDEQKDFLAQLWKNGEVDGQRLGMPALTSGTFLFYNQSWAKELQFDNPPDSIESFAAQICAANQFQKGDKEPKNDSTGGWLISSDPSIFLAWLYAFGADIISVSDTGVYASNYHFASTNSEDALYYLKELIDKKCIWSSTELYADEEFVKRRALIASGSPVDLPYQNLAFMEAGSKDEWTILPFPSPLGKPVVVAQVPSFFLVKGEAKEQLAGWVFIRWMTNADSQAKWSALTGYFPVRLSVKDLMKEYADSHPQWATANGLLQYAIPEPQMPSWGDVRWAVEDVETQLTRPYFTTDRIPITLKELDRTAMELQDALR